MAAPAFGSVGAKLTGEAATMNVAVPSGVAAGDIIVVVAFIADTSVTGLPSGFEQADGSPQVLAGGQAQHFYVIWKRATGADAGTYNFTLAANVFREAFAARFTGAIASGDPWDVTDAASVLQGNGVATTPPVSGTTTGPDRLWVFAASDWGGGGWTPPTGYTERQDSGGERTITLADLVQALAGSSGDVSATAASSNFSAAAWLGALLPVDEGGGSEVTGTAATSITVTATASGTRTGAGTAATATTFAATASGTPTVLGAAATTASITATAAGVPTVAGTAATSVAFTATAVEGVQTVTGTAATSITLTATATGTPTVGGTATTSVTFTATGSGTRTVLGAAALAVAFAAAVVTVATRGTGRGTVQSTRTGRHVETTRR